MTQTDGVRVRFAPSPTGALHIGGARTAYFNWLFARQQEGTFILRIDDTDRSRSTEASYQQILDTFRWLGMEWDEGPEVGGDFGPYRQSQRHSIYAAELARLLAEEKAYPCFCTPAQLATDREQAQKEGRAPRYVGRCRHLTSEQRASRLAAGETPAYRIKSPQTGEIVVTDLIRAEVTFAASEIDDFIIWKSDGTPTYHLASCIDDAQMRITHVIRAEEHLSNTPRHIVLFRALGVEVPHFAHVPMILAPDRSKLSKRHGATSVEEFRTDGVLPAAIVNYLLLLGFSPPGDKELVSSAEAVSMFDLTRVSTHAAIYDIKKLEWINMQYLHAAAPDELLEWTWQALEARGWALADADRNGLAWLRAAVHISQSRARTISDVVDTVGRFVEPPTEYDSKGVRKHFTVDAADRLERAAAQLDEVRPFLSGRVERSYRKLIDQWGLKGGELIHPTRLALTGVTVGPGLFDIMAILGWKECQARLRTAASAIRAGQFG